MAERVWIIGASYGIGRALALELAGRGDTVIASARSADKLVSLEEQGAGRIRAMPLDVTDHAAVQEAMAAIEAEHGGLDTAVLNAGTHRPTSARSFKASELRVLVELNLMGTANALEAVMPGMIRRRGGRIAIVASLVGYRGLPTAAYYGASKAALINMAESLRFDLEAAGVRLQLVNPGFVRTPLTDRNDFPMPFLISAEEAARHIARGLAGDRFEIPFPWQLVWMMKLARLLPYALYFPMVGRRTRRQ